MADTSEQVVSLLNQGMLATGADEKIIALQQVEELTVKKQPELLDNFFDVRPDRHRSCRACLPFRFHPAISPRLDPSSPTSPHRSHTLSCVCVCVCEGGQQSPLSLSLRLSF
jgi:hypothetical protein